MVLEYKFEYLSNNSVLINFIDKILTKKSATYKVFKDNAFIFLYIEDEEKKLLNISEELAKELPMSIFIKNYTLKVVPEIPNKDYDKKIDKYNLSYCSNCLANIEDQESRNFYNPFFDCDICGTTCDVGSLELYENNKKISYTNYKQLFETIALKILEDKRVKIKTPMGEYVYSKINTKLDKNTKLICTNINNISKLVVSSKEKTIALLSIEKPAIDFNINQIYKTNNNITIDKVNIKFADSRILYLLSKELIFFDIDFITYEKSNDFDFELTYDLKQEYKTTPKIVINDSKTLLLENNYYDKNLDTIYNKFNQKAKSQFMVLLEENDLHEKSILNLYSSTKDDDNICLYSKKFDGMLDILNYKIPSSIKSIFDEISKDEIGKKLIENYKKKFPNTYKNAIESTLENSEKESIYSLWKIASLVLGFENKDLEENIIFSHASNAVLEKGPRVDYKLFDSQKIFNKEFNINKFIQSGISFKLAGVDDKTLSLGYVESFSYFLANIVDEVNSEFEIDGVSLCGDMIANELFYKLLHKAITKNFKIYYNKDFPIQK